MSQADPEATSLIGRRPRATLALAVLLGVAATIALRALPQGVPVGRTPVMAAVLDDPGSPSVGPPDAPVILAVFADYQCPVCKAREGDLEKVRQAHPEVRFVFKDWPIFGPRSEDAARVALAAAYQGRYLPVHEALMNSGRRLDAPTLQALATGAGADWPRLQADLAAHRLAIDAQLDRHARQAWTLGLSGTPAYVVGTDLYSGGMGRFGLGYAIVKARRRGVWDRAR